MESFGDRLLSLQNRYQRLTGMEEGRREQVKEYTKGIEDGEVYGDRLAIAQAVVQGLADQARQEFRGDVNRLVTMVVRSVFTEDFSFDMQMSTEGGRLQCKPVVIERVEDVEIEYAPKDDMGGSVLDPIGFALRVVLQQFQRSRTRGMFVLDEPMKNVGHGDLLNQAGAMMAEVSHEVGLQLIVITHEPELAELADRAYQVVRGNNGESSIEVIVGGEVDKGRRIVK
jgi:hypothetical protein